jgi:hypothetical protein
VVLPSFRTFANCFQLQKKKILFSFYLPIFESWKFIFRGRSVQWAEKVVTIHLKRGRGTRRQCLRRGERSASGRLRRPSLSLPR